MGISVQASGIGIRADKYYLVNLNADPSTNKLLVCYLKVTEILSRMQLPTASVIDHYLTQVGNADVQPSQDIQLRGWILPMNMVSLRLWTWRSSSLHY